MLIQIQIQTLVTHKKILTTVKLGDKEHFDKEQLGVKELFTVHQPFHIINLLLDKEFLPVLEILVNKNPGN